jgi:uncharacterized protein YjbJ (UPF0337 family)
MISNERIEGNWNSVVGAVRKRFGDITGDDLQRAQGSAEQLVGLLQRKTGQSREQIEAFLNDCCQSTSETMHRISEKAGEYAQHAGEAMRENYDYLSSNAQRGYDYTLRSMSRRPVESVAIALGAGVLAGLIVGLSMTSSRRH